VHAGHVDVQQYHQRPFLAARGEAPLGADEVEGAFAVPNHLDPVDHAGPLEVAAHQQRVPLVILSQQDGKRFVRLSVRFFGDFGHELFSWVADGVRLVSVAPLGNSTKKVLPSPSLDSTQTRPPCRCTTRWTIASPSPSPLWPVVALRR